MFATLPGGVLVPSASSGVFVFRWSIRGRAATQVCDIGVVTVGYLMLMPILPHQLAVSVNRPPRGGVVTVAPVAGIALNTNFTARALSWVDPEADLPLSYRFLASANLRAAAPLVLIRADAPSNFRQVRGKREARGMGPLPYACMHACMPCTHPNPTNHPYPPCDAPAGLPPRLGQPDGAVGGH
jgi:hypothetical protein